LGIYLWVSLFLMSVAAIIASGSSIAHGTPLPDFIHERVDLRKYESQAYWFIAPFGVVTFLRLFWERNWQLYIRRFLLIYAVLVNLRTITLLATFYPDPSALCKDAKIEQVYNPLHNSQVWSLIPFTCGDMMFSGHTSYFTLLSLLWWNYMNKPKILPILFIALASSNVFLLVAARVHYTNDVLIALFLSLGCWHLYHHNKWEWLERDAINPPINQTNLGDDVRTV